MSSAFLMKDGPLSEEEIEIALANSCNLRLFQRGRHRFRVPDTSVVQVAHLLRLQDDKQNRVGSKAWAKMPRTYIILRTIESLEALPQFLDDKYSDFNLPYNNRTLPLFVGDEITRKHFLEVQECLLTNGKELDGSKPGQLLHLHIDGSGDNLFERIRSLGRGGFAEVDLVRNRLSFKQYARKKVYRGRWTVEKTNLRSQEAIVAEINALRLLEHRHLVKICGSYTDKEYIAFLMVPVATCNLEEFLRQSGGLNEGDRHDIRKWYGCLASAIHYLHQTKIRHRDLSSRNILILEGRVYVGDLGAAYDWSGRNESMTHHSNAPYSYQYMAPELARREPRSSSSDMWSLGIIFLEMTTLLLGRTLDDLQEAIERRAGPREPYVWANPSIVTAWATQLLRSRIRKGTYDKEPLEWVTALLHERPEDRPNSRGLVRDVLNSASSGIFCCLVCDSEYKKHGSDIEDSLASSQTRFKDSDAVKQRAAEILEDKLAQPSQLSVQKSLAIDRWLAGSNSTPKSHQTIWGGLPIEKTRKDVKEVCSVRLHGSQSDQETFRVDDSRWTARPYTTQPFQTLHIPVEALHVPGAFPLDPIVESLDHNETKKQEKYVKDTGLGFLEYHSSSSSEEDDDDARHFNERDDSSGSEYNYQRSKNTVILTKPGNVMSDSTISSSTGVRFFDALYRPSEDQEESQAKADHHLRSTDEVEEFRNPRELVNLERSSTSNLEDSAISFADEDIGAEERATSASEGPQFDRGVLPDCDKQSQDLDKVQSHVGTDENIEMERGSDGMETGPCDVKERPPYHELDQTVTSKLQQRHHANTVEKDSKVLGQNDERALNGLEGQLIPHNHGKDGLSHNREEKDISHDFVEQDISKTTSEHGSIFVAPAQLAIEQEKYTPTALAEIDQISTQSLPARDAEDLAKWAADAEHTCVPTTVTAEAITVCPVRIAVENSDDRVEEVEEKLNAAQLTMRVPVKESENPEDTEVESSDATESTRSKRPLFEREDNSVRSLEVQAQEAHTDWGSYLFPVALSSVARKKPRRASSGVQNGFRHPRILEERHLELTTTNVAALEEETTPAPSSFKRKSREPVPKINATAYMEGVWEASSSCVNPKMTEKTAHLLKKANINKFFDKDHRLLEYFCAQGKATAVRTLLAQGCNPGRAGQYRRPGPIMLAIRGASEKHNSCVRALVKAGVDVNATAHRLGKTPLHAAIENPDFEGYTSLIRELIEAGADTNQADLSGNYPLLKLFYADGTGPLAMHRRDALALLLRREQPATVVNIAQPSTLNTPLHLAVRRNDVLAVAMLLHRKADVNAKNASGLTPLLVATRRLRRPLSLDLTRMIDLLLSEAGIAVDERAGVDQQTALHRAVKAGIWEVVEQLLQRGADPWCTNNEDQNSLTLATEHAHEHSLEDHFNIMSRLIPAMRKPWPVEAYTCACNACQNAQPWLA